MRETLVHGHFLVHGRVQGVGFRYFTYYRANSIGVTGFVRNLPNDTVEAVAEGSAAQVTAFLHSIEEGPRFSFVERVEKSIKDVKKREWRDFSIR